MGKSYRRIRGFCRDAAMAVNLIVTKTHKGGKRWEDSSYWESSPGACVPELRQKGNGTCRVSNCCQKKDN